MRTDPLPAPRIARRAVAAIALGAAALGAPALAHASLPCHAYVPGSDIRQRCEYNEWSYGGGGRQTAPPFGAIAYAPGSRVAGTSAGEASRARAEQRAVKACRDIGGKDCTVAIWFSGRCGALAVSPGGAWASTFAYSAADASRTALADCARRAKGEACTVATTRCSG